MPDSPVDADHDEKQTFHLFKPVKSNDSEKGKDEELAYFSRICS